jgi:transposase-like protein
VVDGAKGFHAALRQVFRDRGVLQRCRWHKRENVVEYLPLAQRAAWRRKLQAASEKPTYEAARAAVQALRRELAQLNQSAAASLDEGLEETLTLHRLGLARELGLSVATTNIIESINAPVGPLTDHVDHYRSSDQKQRWVGPALLEIEPRLRRVRGKDHLPTLRAALQRELQLLPAQAVA